MGCTSCQMPGMEGFTNFPMEGFASEKAYECQKQKDQTCFYTAQGDMVCKKEDKGSVSAPTANVLGYGLVDKYAPTPITEKFTNKNEHFIRGSTMMPI